MSETIFRRHIRILGNWVEILGGMQRDLRKIGYVMPVPEENIEKAVDAIGLAMAHLEAIQINLKVLDEVAAMEVKE